MIKFDFTVQLPLLGHHFLGHRFLGRSFVFYYFYLYNQVKNQFYLPL